MKSKKPTLPMYEKYTDNQYQTRNRPLAEKLGDWLNTNYSSIDPTSKSFNLGSKGYAGNLNNMTLNNLAKNYTTPTNERLGSQYNTSLYTGDLNSLLNSDLQTRLDSSNAAKYGERVNDYYKLNLANLMARYNQYVPSGEDINAADQINNNITNQNKDREYINEMIRDQGKANPWNIVKSTIEGAQKGNSWLPGWGALIGAVAGAGQGFANEYTDIGWTNNGKGLSIIEKVPSNFGGGGGGFSFGG